MNTLDAYLINHSTPNGHARAFDWARAVKILEERKPDTATAGLSEDMEWTGTIIWKNGKPYREKGDCGFLASRWATPVLICDGAEIECWIPIEDEEIGHYADLRWPELEVL